MHQNILSFRFASKKILNDKEVVLASMHRKIELYEFASENIKNDKEVVLLAVKYNGKFL
jgi:hypothetical protein